MKRPVFLDKMLFSINKKSPEILLVTGIVGGIAAAVMACKKTLAAKEVVDRTRAKVEEIRSVENEDAHEEDQRDDQTQKELVDVYVKTGIDLVKLYAMPVGLGVASIFCILSSNNIMRKRISGLAAAYAIVDTNFKEYRKRVVERYGEEADKELRFDVKTEEVVDDNGEVRQVQKTNYSGMSEYGRFYENGCKGWERDPEYNLMFLRAQQQYANDLLRARGFLFLNEVYDMLGMPLSDVGQLVGWIYDYKNPQGDNCVDFGLYELNPTNVQLDKHSVPYNHGFIVDFNVDGYILDKAVDKHLLCQARTKK